MKIKVQIILSVLTITILLGLPVVDAAYSPVLSAAIGQAEEASVNLASAGVLSDINIQAIAVGGFHTCALTDSGRVKCWGVNTTGQLGNGTTIDSVWPVNVSGLTGDVVALATGWNHTCALIAGGGVKCWGDNAYGQLGDGTTSNQNLPADVSGLTSGVVALAASGHHTCALLSGGSAKCWGENYHGELGDGTNKYYSTMPVDVSGLTSGVAALAAGGNHNCALTSGGGVKCWGYNYYGQLGDGTKINQNTPQDVDGLTSGIASLAVGGYHTCAVTTEGGAKCWGYNMEGQLGDDTTTGSVTPVDVSGLSSGVAALVAGGHTCALTTQGGVLCWGLNNHGQLGDGTTLERLTPVGVTGLSSGVAALSTESSTVGTYHTCALTANGGVKCWGANGYGQLGDWTKTTRLIPVDVNFSVRYAFLPLVSRNYCPDFYDDFGNPASGWPVGEDDYARSEYLDGEFRILSKIDGYIYLFKAPSCERDAYSVEVDARWEGATGSSYGIIFGLKGDFTEYYLFDVNTDYRQYRLYRRSSEGFTPIISPSSSGAIHEGTAANHLKVTRNGNWISLYANGVILDTRWDSNIAGSTGAGVVSGPYLDYPISDARFDNFRIQAVSSPGAPASNQGTAASLAPFSGNGMVGSRMSKDFYSQLDNELDWQR